MPRSSGNFEDWSVLKWGWLAIFALHIFFLIVGVHFIKEALNMQQPALLHPSEQRIGLIIEALYALTIAFSIILLILAVFVLEIFRAQRQLVARLEMLAQSGAGSAASASTGAGASAPAAAAGTGTASAGSGGV